MLAFNVVLKCCLRQLSCSCRISVPFAVRVTYLVSLNNRKFTQCVHSSIPQQTINEHTIYYTCSLLKYICERRAEHFWSRNLPKTAATAIIEMFHLQRVRSMWLRRSSVLKYRESSDRHDSVRPKGDEMSVQNRYLHNIHIAHTGSSNYIRISLAIV